METQSFPLEKNNNKRMLFLQKNRPSPAFKKEFDSERVKKERLLITFVNHRFNRRDFTK
jgi:hypothetical protein